MTIPLTGAAWRRHPRRTTLVAVTVLVLLVALVLGVLRWRAHRLTLSEQQLAVALVTFRPPEHPGKSDELAADALGTEDQVRASPDACLPLVRLAPAGGLGGAWWSGASGSPLQPVRTLTVRFRDPAAARHALADKRAALRRCDRAELRFPPFRQPVQTFTVEADGLAAYLPVDHLNYRLTSTDTYQFYLRRYGNTLTWSYANVDQIDDTTGGRVRQAVVDDLVARLRQLVQK